MTILKAALALFKDALSEFLKERASIFAAGLAYYTIFSLAPLLVFVTAVAGLFIGRSAAGDQLVLQMQYLLGSELADVVAGAMEALTDRSANRAATLLSAGVLFVGAGGIFRQLKAAFNLLWDISSVRPRNAREWLILIRYRAIPFLMVFVFGLLLGLAVILEAVLGVVSARLEVLFPEITVLLSQSGRLLVPALTFVTFLLMFKFLPDAETRWRDMAVGALVTTGLFLIGRALLMFFLSFSDTGSIYGTAGSVVILMFWIYYSAQILLYGVEFTWLYALRHGQPIRPNQLARITDTVEGVEGRLEIRD